MTEADTLTLINELQSKIDKLPTKGTLKALQFRLDAILQANLDTFWLFCLLYTSPSPRDVEESRMPSSA